MMIMIESELRPIARRGISNDELELARYAARELRARPLVLVRDLVRARAEKNGDRSQAALTSERRTAGVAAEV
jgi:hypothetical protein